jgi:hypothetical protein
VAWVAPAVLASGLRQLGEDLGQIPATTVPTIFNFQIVYSFQYFKNPFKFQTFIENNVNIIKIQRKFLWNPLG